MADLPAPKLALNGRGGEAMTNTCRLLKYDNEDGFNIGMLLWSHTTSLPIRVSL